MMHFTNICMAVYVGCWSSVLGEFYKLHCRAIYMFFRVQEDHGRGTKVQLLEDNEEASLPLINLLLTGRAVRFLHNGDITFNEMGELLVCICSPTSHNNLPGWLGTYL